MCKWIVFAIVFFVVSSQVFAESVSGLNKKQEGVYQLKIDGVAYQAYTASALREKLNKISQLNEHIKSLEKLSTAQEHVVSGQKAQLTRMQEQLKDYRSLTTKLEELLRLKPNFNKSAGLGYFNGEATGMLGLGYGDWRIMGIASPASTGFIVSKDF